MGDTQRRGRRDDAERGTTAGHGWRPAGHPAHHPRQDQRLHHRPLAHEARLHQPAIPTAGCGIDQERLHPSRDQNCGHRCPWLPLSRYNPPSHPTSPRSRSQVLHGLGATFTERLADISCTDLLNALIFTLDPDLNPPSQIIASLRTLNTFFRFNRSFPAPASLYQPLTQLFQLHRKPHSRAIVTEQVQLSAMLLERTWGNTDLADEFVELEILNAMLSFMYSFTFATWDLQNDYSFNKALPSVYSRLLPSLLFALAAVIKDDQSRARHVATAKPSSPLVGAMFEEEYPMMRILLRLTKNIHGSVKLGAVECLTYMFRVGAVGRREASEINNLVVPVLVRLFDDSPNVRMRAPQILGGGSLLRRVADIQVIWWQIARKCRKWLVKQTQSKSSPR